MGASLARLVALLLAAMISATTIGCGTGAAQVSVIAGAAIHGRDGASLSDPLGSARSHGCTRIDDGSIDWMAANIPQGTPVQITG